jgi:hypothetical protein
MNRLTRFACGLALLGGLAACAEQAAPAASTRRVFLVDTQGQARTCTVPQRVALTPGQQAEAAMTVSNEGGWCGITVAQAGPRPYDAGMLVQRPQRGRVHVRRVGDVTRVDYIPDAGASGTDAFTVRMAPGNAALQVNVAIQGGATPAAAPAAAPARR